ncbi:RtcB family protein [Flavitalea flava]
MSTLKLSGKDLRAIGYPEGPVITIAMKIMEKNYKFNTKEEVMNILRAILAAPVEYEKDAIFGLIAQRLIPAPEPAHKPALQSSSEPAPGSANDAENAEIKLKDKGIPFNIFGRDHIEQGAMDQMEIASRLPIVVAGALMPDAHSGYGLPIGGVLATENAVIPYGVGVDIGCRMCLSVFDISPEDLVKRESFFIRELGEATLFGSGRFFDKITPHEVLERKEFKEIGLLRDLQGKAARQLGSSGSGNHFVEFGVVEIGEKDPVLGLDAGKYLGLLSHSGSRGLGATIAGYYTRLAKEKRPLPKEAVNLAWLNLDEQEGMEYWLAMNLAGDYSSACHQVIHEKIALQLGRQPVTRVENHHNFAWKEIVDGHEVIVHRKGATPAGKDVLGVIPGSMTAPGYIVKGKGESGSVYSASHGAGRKMSRTAALQSITQQALQEMLDKHGVKLLGGGLDEAPFAYKDIDAVMGSQGHLVKTLGKFIPKIVKMDGTKPGRSAARRSAR